MTPELTKLVRPPTYVQNVYGDAKSWQAWTPYGRFIYGVDFAGKFYTQTPEGETDHPSLLAAEGFAHKSYAARVSAALDAELLAEVLGALGRWYQTGCPDCGGDCASANPPVSLCLPQQTRAILAKLGVQP